MIKLLTEARKTIILFNKDFKIDYDNAITLALELIKVKAKFIYIDKNIQFVEYRINVRLRIAKRNALIKALYNIAGIKQPVEKKLPKLPNIKTYKNVCQKDTGIITGFIGNIVIGTHQYLYK